MLRILKLLTVCIDFLHDLLNGTIMISQIDENSNSKIHTSNLINNLLTNFMQDNRNLTFVYHVISMIFNFLSDFNQFRTLPLYKYNDG